mgnify:FL=1
MKISGVFRVKFEWDNGLSLFRFNLIKYNGEYFWQEDMPSSVVTSGSPIDIVTYEYIREHRIHSLPSFSATIEQIVRACSC